MKKNKYIYVFAAALGLGFSACSSDDLAVEGQGATEGNGAAGADGKGVVFTSRIADELEILDEEGGESTPGTRSVISGGQFAGWTKGDAVSVSDGTLCYGYQVKETTDGTTCSFEVKPGNNEFTGDDGKKFYAFYPETAITGAAGRGGWNGSTVKAMVFAEQDYAENMDGGAFGAYMVSEAAPLKNGDAFFTFHLAASVIEVNLSTLGVTPKSVSVKSNSGVSLAGLLKYDCSTRTAAVSTTDKTDYAASTQSEVVTVSNIAADATLVRFYVLPVQLVDGVTITVQDTDGNFYTKTTSTKVGTPAEEGLTSIDGLNGATVCKPYYKKYNFGAASTATRLNNWMATIPGNVPFCQLSVPGAHDAATKDLSAFYQTQSKDISALLACGVRAFDFRPRYTSNTVSDIELANLEIYHSDKGTGVLFKDAMATLVEFVQDNPTEALYVRIKEEDSGSGTDQTTTWRASICECLEGYYNSGKGDVLGKLTAGMTLGECRGKLVVTADKSYGDNSPDRYTTNKVFGGILKWDDATSGQECSIYHTNKLVVASAYVQDAYTASTSNKKNYVKETLDKSTNDFTMMWYSNWLNIGYNGVFPADHASTMNKYVVNELLPNCSGRIGIMFYDYCGDSSRSGVTLNNAIIGQNHKYVYNNRSRVHMPDNTGINVDGNEAADGTEVYSIGLR